MDILHTQDLLQQAVKEAKALNLQLEQNKEKFKAAKMNLDNKLLHLFIPKDSLEKQQYE